MSALPPKADMCGATRDVRYGPIADIRLIISVSRSLPRSRPVSTSYRTTAAMARKAAAIRSSLRHCLHPVAFLPRWGLRSEPHSHRAVSIFLDCRLVAVNACKLLVRLEHRARLIVVHRKRPELPSRNWSGQRNLVGLAAVEIAPLRVARRRRIS